MSPALEVLRPGLLATVQDLGRFGYQQFGLGTAGAMDAFALQVANVLVGNERGAAALEIAGPGSALRALDDLAVSICGADLGASVDGRPAPLWKSFLLKKGEELRFGAPSKGVWACLAVGGGIDVEPALGSRATYLRAKLGGLQGRVLAAGDVLCSNAYASSPSKLAGRALAFSEIPRYENPAQVRVVWGPQEDAFAPEGLTAFRESEYKVTAQSDRMGYRLKGPEIRHRESADIISDATAPGSIQIPADGQPIVLLADRATTGGYAKIATVVSVDIPRVVQTRAGGNVRFHPIAIEEAQDLAAERERFLSGLEQGVARG